MALYLIPMVQTTINSQTVNAPKYLIALNQNFGCIPYGVEGTGLVETPQHPTLDGASDVFAFPADLGTVLSDANVKTLDNFCLPLNIPSTGFVAGMTFEDVARTIACVFLLAQAISGSQGGAASIFPSGTTLDSAVQPAQQVNLGMGKNILNATPSALTDAAGNVVGPFNLTSVDTSQSVGDVLLSVSQQFSQPILVSGGTL
jgi:hypothetical protein